MRLRKVRCKHVINGNASHLATPLYKPSIRLTLCVDVLSVRVTERRTWLQDLITVLVDVVEIVRVTFIKAKLDLGSVWRESFIGGTLEGSELHILPFSMFHKHYSTHTFLELHAVTWCVEGALL